MNPRRSFTGLCLLLVLAVVPLAGVTASSAPTASAIAHLPSSRPDLAPSEPQDVSDATANSLMESGRWEWAGGGTLNDIFFLDAAHGWAVGTGVWKTVDGGATWYRVPIFEQTALQRAEFTAAGLGYAIGAIPLVRTTDGGENWQAASSGEDLGSLALAGSTDVWAVGTGQGRLLRCHPQRTVPAFHRQWRDVADRLAGPPSLATGLTDVAFFDREHGWMAGSEANPGGVAKPVVWRTSDRGASWQSVPLDDSVGAGDIEFGSATSGWLATGTTLWRSTDAGATWTPQIMGGDPVTWLQAESASSVWMRRRHTLAHDGWWRCLGPLAGTPPAHVRFRTATEGWGVTAGDIFRTTDSGASWQKLFTVPTRAAEWYHDPLTGWRANGAGPARTTDGGATWTNSNTGLTAVDGFQFVSATAGWAWHDGSLALRRTTDGGVTWQTQATGGDTMDDIQFVDAAHGWVRKAPGSFDARPTAAQPGRSWERCRCPSPA